MEAHRLERRGLQSKFSQPVTCQTQRLLLRRLLLQLHDDLVFVGTFQRALAEGQATAHEVMSITRHRTLEEVEN